MKKTVAIITLLVLILTVSAGGVAETFKASKTLAVHAGASLNSAVIAHVKKGAKKAGFPEVKLDKDGIIWFKFVYKGRTGYINCLNTLIEDVDMMLVVRKPVCVRADASPRAKKLGKLKEGVRFKCAGTIKNGWVKVQHPKTGQYGWVYMAYLKEYNKGY